MVPTAKRDGENLYIVMMKLRFLLLGCSLLLSSSLFSQVGSVNDYGLRVVSDPDEYATLVKGNPDLELINLRSILSRAVFDIRYATENNFTGKVVYAAPEAFLCKPAAQALLLAEEDLAEQGLGLKILDAFRPYQATIKFWKIVQNADYAADPRKGSRHNRGCAVDLTLISLANFTELQMPTEFDDFSHEAAADYADLPQIVIKNRLVLKTALEKYGFSQLSSEWWHFDFKGWNAYPVLDIPFDRLPTQ